MVIEYFAEYLVETSVQQIEPAFLSFKIAFPFIMFTYWKTRHRNHYWVTLKFQVTLVGHFQDYNKTYIWCKVLGNWMVSNDQLVFDHRIFSVSWWRHHTSFISCVFLVFLFVLALSAGFFSCFVCVHQVDRFSYVTNWHLQWNKIFIRCWK